MGVPKHPQVRFVALRFQSPEGQMLWRRGKSYSQYLRERVFAAADEGEPVGRIATMLRVSVSYVSKVLSRRRLTGQTQARPQRCHVVPKLSGLYPAIEAQVSRRPDATIAELRVWLLETHRVSASAGLMNKALAALDLTLKRMARPVCKCFLRSRLSSLRQGIRSRDCAPAKMEIRAPRS